MKKLCLLLSMIFLTTFTTLPAQASGGENGNGLQKPMAAEVFKENGRIYVSLSYLGEALEAQVKWLSNGDKAGIIILTKGNDGAVFRMDKKDFTVIREGQAAALMEMDVTPISKEGRLYLPARYVTSMFGYNFQFNEADNAIHITQTGNANTNTSIPEVDNKVLAQEGRVIKGLLTSIFTLYALVP